jgi:hypothetical protein
MTKADENEFLYGALLTDADGMVGSFIDFGAFWTPAIGRGGGCQVEFPDLWPLAGGGTFGGRGERAVYSRRFCPRFCRGSIRF